MEYTGGVFVVQFLSKVRFVQNGKKAKYYHSLLADISFYSLNFFKRFAFYNCCPSFMISVKLRKVLYAA